MWIDSKGCDCQRSYLVYISSLDAVIINGSEIPKSVRIVRVNYIHVLLCVFWDAQNIMELDILLHKFTAEGGLGE